MAVYPAAAKALFLEAAALSDPTARAALVTNRCGGDAELRARVEALLVANDRALANAGTASFGGANGADPAEPTADHPGRDGQAGAVIGGKYTLVEPIGEGGMGSVWRAKQTEPVKRFVAVKLIKAGMDSKQVLARFEAERQALALMDHPNIAKVLDGGLHDGRPFFVMELVKGVPITAFCDERKLTPRERLELFVPVCQAIQHAHQKGVIHRDIKPSNVLIALYDDRPVVKVIDFGVAKATGAALTERTIDTGFGGVVGTPEYMSPEQATLNNLDIDTRSDVYALGVLLYELLAGSPPFQHKELEKRGFLEMLRVVREEEPPRPSTKLSTADALPALSANRGTEPKKLTGLLKNELDWVVMKALEKDRTRRYETANAFAADVQRYLSGEAVQAHPPSTAYRVKKFVRRNKGRVLAAGLVLLALLAGIAGTTLGLIEARRQEDAARKQEKIARDETAEKEQARLGEIEQRNLALGRAADLKYRLGVSEMVLAGAAYDNRDVVLAAERLDNVPAEQRGWEWHYLKQQARGGLYTLRGHKGPVLGVAFSPDGERVVTAAAGAGQAAEVKVWDAQTGLIVFEVSDLAGFQSLVGKMGGQTTRTWESQSFGLGGTRLATAGRDHTARVWDVRTGKLQCELKHSGPLARVGLSPDGSRAATACLDGAVTVWDVETGKPLWEFKGSGDWVRACFSPDGTRVFVGPLANKSTRVSDAKVLDAKTGNTLLDLPGERGFSPGFNGLAFSPDGTRIVAGGTFTLKGWEVPSAGPGGRAERGGPPLIELKVSTHTNVAGAVSFSPDGTRILAASNNGNAAHVWDARTGARLFALNGRRSPVTFGLWETGWGEGEQGAAFSPDGTRIVTVGGQNGAHEGTVWDARTGAELLALTGHTNAVLCAAFSPDGTKIVTGSADGTAKVWDARTGTPRLEMSRPGGELYVAAFSPGGARVLSAVGAEEGPGAATVWDARTGAALFELKGFKGVVKSAAFSRDGTRIVTGGYIIPEGNIQQAVGEVNVWDARTGALLLELKGPSRGVNSVAISPDGTRILTAAGGPLGIADVGELTVWDARTGAVLLDLTRPASSGSVFDYRGASVAFSPDGTRFVAGGLEWKGPPNWAGVWDAATGAPLFELKGHTNSLLCVAYSPDGARVVTGGGDLDRRALVWDARTGALLLELKGHTSAVLCAAFSPDGTRIVTGSDDRTVRVWDAKTGTSLLELRGFRDRLMSVAFSPDGTRLVTGDFSGTVTVWDSRVGKDAPDEEELAYRRLHTEPNVRRYKAGYDETRAAGDDFAARFYLDRLIALSAAANQPDEVKKWRAERAKYPDAAQPPREKK